MRYQVDILDLVRDLADEHGVAVGVVLHDLNQAADVADDITMLHKGVIQATGSPAHVLTADRVSAVYGLPVAITRDAVTSQVGVQPVHRRSEEHTSELQSLMRNSYAVFCLKKKKRTLMNSSTQPASQRPPASTQNK